MDKKLLFSLSKKDFEITFMRCGGPGGQKQNKTSSGCRIVHILSGAASESRTERSQSVNKKLAFERLISSTKFKKWIKLEICRKSGMLDNINNEVDLMMSEENLKTEVLDEHNKWVEVKPEILDADT